MLFYKVMRAKRARKFFDNLSSFMTKNAYGEIKDKEMWRRLQSKSVLRILQHIIGTDKTTFESL